MEADDPLRLESSLTDSEESEEDEIQRIGPKLSVFGSPGATRVTQAASAPSSDAAARQQASGSEVSQTAAQRVPDRGDSSFVAAEQTAHYGNLTAPSAPSFYPWVQVPSSQGDLYWFNTVTSASVWDTPAEVQAAQRALSTATSASAGPAEMPSNKRTHSAATGANEETLRKRTRNDSSGSSGSQQGAAPAADPTKARSITIRGIADPASEESITIKGIADTASDDGVRSPATSPSSKDSVEVEDINRPRISIKGSANRSASASSSDTSAAHGLSSSQRGVKPADTVKISAAFLTPKNPSPLRIDSTASLIDSEPQSLPLEARLDGAQKGADRTNDGPEAAANGGLDLMSRISNSTHPLPDRPYYPLGLPPPDSAANNAESVAPSLDLSSRLGMRPRGADDSQRSVYAEGTSKVSPPIPQRKEMSDWSTHREEPSSRTTEQAKDWRPTSDRDSRREYAPNQPHWDRRDAQWNSRGTDRDVRDSRDTRDPRDAREYRHPRDSRDSRDTRAPYDARDARQQTSDDTRFRPSSSSHATSASPSLRTATGPNSVSLGANTREPLSTSSVPEKQRSVSGSNMVPLRQNGRAQEAAQPTSPTSAQRVPPSGNQQINGVSPPPGFQAAAKQSKAQPQTTSAASQRNEALSVAPLASASVSSAPKNGLPAAGPGGSAVGSGPNREGTSSSSASPASKTESEWAKKKRLSRPPLKHWGWSSPTSLLVPEDLSPAYFFILLNQPIAKAHKQTFQRLWQRAQYRICADGAANRLHDLMGGQRAFGTATEEGPVNPGDADLLCPPNEIVGDLDSLRPEIRTLFEARGTKVVHRPSQYATDLQKAVQRAEDMEVESDGYLHGDLVIFGGLSGRFDQTCHTLHVLWQLAEGVETLEGVADPNGERGGKLRKRNRTWVISDDSVTWLLPPGQHDLQMSHRVMGKTCGILPLGVGIQNGGARVTTKGLEWDLDAGTASHLGGLLSTSNHMANEDGIVKVQTDQPVYWTVELKSDQEIAAGSAKRT